MSRVKTYIRKGGQVTLRRQTGGSRTTNWGKGHAPVPDNPTRFHALLAELGIPEEEAGRSHAVRQFVKKNFNKYFVPEWLIEEMGLHPRDEDVECSGVFSR